MIKMVIQLLVIIAKDVTPKLVQEQQFMHTDKKVLTHYLKGDKMIMKKLTFEEVMSVLKNDDNSPFTNYTVEDIDGNQIRAENLYILDFHQMREWVVDSICIDEWGRATIVLNSGNFNSFHFKNVQ